MNAIEKKKLRKALKSSNMISKLDIQLTGLMQEEIVKFSEENGLEWKVSNRFGMFIYFEKNGVMCEPDELKEMLK